MNAAEKLQSLLTASNTATGENDTDLTAAIGSLIAGQGITPTGSISITANGTEDVTQYATAVVNVSGGRTVSGSYTPASTVMNVTMTHNAGFDNYIMCFWADPADIEKIIEENVSMGIVYFITWRFSDKPVEYDEATAFSTNIFVGKYSSSAFGTQLTNSSSNTAVSTKIANCRAIGGVTYHYKIWELPK